LKSPISNDRAFLFVETTCAKSSIPSPLLRLLGKASGF
jgi:hypothetical protein